MNNYTVFDARLVQNPDKVDLQGGKTLARLRIADNAAGKKDDKRPARFVTVKAFGQQADALLKLVKGDVITVSGRLTLEAYKSKAGDEKTEDVLQVDSFRVQKSETYFGEKATPADTADTELPF